MKCPKCGYLGFEHVERCRNCGYQFSLASSPRESDLNLREPSSALGSSPLRDLTLDVDAGTPGELALGGERTMRSSERGLTTRSAGELPLFPKASPDDVRTVLPPAPRPLAVRRATPEIRKARVEPRVEPRAPMLELAREVEAPPVTRAAPREPVRAAPPVERRATVEGAEPASIGERGMAACLDALLLGVIDAVVIYFTLRISGLTIADLGLLPKWPLATFLGLQNLAYLVAFTIGGQTLGKMAAGIRVVSAADGGSLSVGRAIIRSVVWAVLAIPAGLGFLTAWLADDQRGLHDRCAGTRVVRASAA